MILLSGSIEFMERQGTSVNSKKSWAPIRDVIQAAPGQCLPAYLCGFKPGLELVSLIVRFFEHDLP